MHAGVPLLGEVKKILACLHKGEAVWLRCGGRAPIDFILIHREDETTVNIRFMDSKHKTNPDDNRIRYIRDEMLAKAKMAYDGLSRAITGSLDPKSKTIIEGVTVSPFDESHLLLITNANSLEDISPATFEWHPWSLVLFFEGVIKQVAQRNQ